MSKTPTQSTTRPTDEIEPMIPIMPTTEPTEEETPRRRPAERQPKTDYATPYTRDTEEIFPGVPDLR